jgi:hypothetical protein
VVAILPTEFTEHSIIDHVVLVGETRTACRILVGKRERKRPLRRLKLRWRGIKLKLIFKGAMVWMHSSGSG